MNNGKKRILVVDDSVFARKIVTDILAGSPELEVAGIAVNGLEALQLIPKLKPDVVTLDIEMPGLDGLETLRRIMAEMPTPVVMVSSLTTEGARESIQALRLGAVDIVAKPHGSHSIGLTAQRDALIAKVIAAANVNIKQMAPVIQAKPALRMPLEFIRPTSAFPVVIIASSTGGPRALRTLVPQLTDAAGVAYIIIQHLPEGFSAPFAQDLDKLTNLNVREAAEGDIVQPGVVLLAKAGYHCVVERAGRVKLTTDPPLWGVRPSADVTMVAAVPVFGSRLIAVVLTGMGRDGANGLKLIAEAGGIGIAEHESSCVVYGMPRAAIETGAVDIIAPLPQIAEAVNAAVIKVARAKAA